MTTDRILCAERLLDATLPASYAPILDALAKLDELSRDKSRSHEERCVEAKALYAQLLQDASLMVESTPPEHYTTTDAFSHWFSEAVLLWTQLPETASPPSIDTAGSKTLAHFPLDLPMDAAAVQQVRRGLGKAFDWRDDELRGLERSVSYITSNLDIKRTLAAALDDYCAHGDRLSPAGRVDLMRAFFGPVPFRPGDVDIVLTSTALFFCIPRQGRKLLVSDWDERPQNERAAIGAFIGKIKKNNIAETDRFPAFGLFSPDDLDPAIVDMLCEVADATREVVIATLATMIHLLPTHKVDIYLIHDSWGHTWQEALCEFEWEYALLPGLDDPLVPGDGPHYGGGSTPTLGSAFVARDGRTELDETRLLRFGRADLAGRLQLAQSVGIAEMLADFMEAKYSRAHLEQQLPTSSLLQSTDLKVDLSLTDVGRQVLRSAEPYRNLAEQEGTRAALVSRLSDAGLPEPGLRDAVERGAQVLRMELEPAFDPSLRAEKREDGTLRSSAMRRLMLKFVLIAEQLERALDTMGAQAESAWTDPVSCPDLFAIATAHFYERDRLRNFWHLDQVLRSELQPACARLRGAMKR